MATLALTTATNLGTQALGIQGTIAATLLTSAAQFAGNALDQRLFGEDQPPRVIGRRLSDLSVQTSTYGRSIPVIYGRSRIAGNVIWARNIKEVAVRQEVESSGGKGGSAPSQSTISYNYYATFAIALCEGEIDNVLRIWADSKLTDINALAASVTIYKGTQTQLPDAVMEADFGAGNVPSYRGIAYMVIEDLQLAPFGNRIPNLTFEVERIMQEEGAQTVEDRLKSMIIIPGSGEFVYDTKVQSKISGVETSSGFAASSTQQAVNSHNYEGKANAVAALDALQETCPNLEWIGVVVSWFCDSLDAGDAQIYPAVEDKDGFTTTPDEWSVAGQARAAAREIGKDTQGKPLYGGTPDDASLVRLLQEARSRGLKVMLYPMIFMEVEGKPWRGHITCDDGAGAAENIASFFTEYSPFITHYATLCRDHIDAFVIGSEFIGLTSVRGAVAGNFPAVDGFVTLAATTRAILDGNAEARHISQTYAADWSEYHHTDGGWYNLDPLWASADIDMVGIDAYFPLTDAPQAGYDKQEIANGWFSGEGYDFVYDEARSTQQAIAAEYAWKNLTWWHANAHINPGGAQTAWVAGSKPVWFTEFGFPSVDGCTNQPNVFYDPASSEGGLPRFSRGVPDVQAQRTAIEATLDAWDGSSIVANKFLWTWDARPYPAYPDRTDVWSDGNLWQLGHWVSGKFGRSLLASIVRDLALRIGLQDGDIDVSALQGLVSGYAITDQTSVASAIRSLQQAFFFDVVESEGVIKFIPRSYPVSQRSISQDDLVIKDKRDENGQLVRITRTPELQLPREVSVQYIAQSSGYQVAAAQQSVQVTDSREKYDLRLPLVMFPHEGEAVARATLLSLRYERDSYSFTLPLQHADLEPGDVITLSYTDADEGAQSAVLRITDTEYGAPNIMKVKAVPTDSAIYEAVEYHRPDAEAVADGQEAQGKTDMLLLDLPALPTESAEGGLLYAALNGEREGWAGAAIYRKDSDSAGYRSVTSTTQQAIRGRAVTVLGGQTDALNIFDHAHSVEVVMQHGELESVTQQAVLNGSNIAYLGGEVIQFADAQYLGQGRYLLSTLLRGRFGTEGAMTTHAEMDDFVLLTSDLTPIRQSSDIIGLMREYKAVTEHTTLDDADAQSVTYSARRLRPLAPVHVCGTRDEAGNLDISWIRRTRQGGAWRDYVDIPLGEEREAYRVEILDGSDVVRALEVSSPDAVYAASEQVSDFGALQPSIDVRISQISATTGVGMHAAMTI